MASAVIRNNFCDYDLNRHEQALCQFHSTHTDPSVVFMFYLFSFKELTLRWDWKILPDKKKEMYLVKDSPEEENVIYIYLF